MRHAASPKVIDVGSIWQCELNNRLLLGANSLPVVSVSAFGFTRETYAAVKCRELVDFRQDLLKRRKALVLLIFLEQFG